MDDRRLRLAFYGTALATAFVLNPFAAAFAPAPSTVLPVSTMAMAAMLLGQILDTHRGRRARRAAGPKGRPAPRTAPSPNLLMLGVSFVMAMQAMIIFATSSASRLPDWTAPWAFLAMALAVEAMILLVLARIAAEALGRSGHATGA